ncbi:MAG: DUF3267 domain-containing protein [Lachnospiraceae bacterium]|nr:DUF3267 domain-containing protein [Lachnospiraceae bacterium]
MIIPGLGILISLVTFPGIAVHEFAHQIFCRFLRIPIFKVVYFRMGNPCGYVEHEACQDPLKVFLTSTGPFLVNTAFGLLILTPVAIPILKFQEYANPLNLLLAWLGFSILMHAFPSTGDAGNMVEQILKNPKVSILPKILSAPVIALIYAGAFGSIFWLDLVYAAAVAMLIPNLLTML